VSDTTPAAARSIIGSRLRFDGKGDYIGGIIERAARATFEAIQADGAGFKEAWDDPSMARVRDTYRAGVRATIAAIREPSEGMIEAAWRADPLNCDVEEGGGRAVHEPVWQAMIDAALEEG
jgi:hypothetical protein